MSSVFKSMHKTYCNCAPATGNVSAVYGRETFK